MGIGRLLRGTSYCLGLVTAGIGLYFAWHYDSGLLLSFSLPLGIFSVYLLCDWIAEDLPG